VRSRRQEVAEEEEEESQQRRARMASSGAGKVRVSRLMWLEAEKGNVISRAGVGVGVEGRGGRKESFERIRTVFFPHPS